MTTLSVILVFLKTVRSTFAMPCDLASGIVRAELPKVNGIGSEKAAVLNHWFRRGCAGPSSFAFTPVLFGRWPPPNELLVLTATLIGSGSPDWNVVPPLMPQPEISLFATPVTLWPIG